MKKYKGLIIWFAILIFAIVTILIKEGLPDKRYVAPAPTDCTQIDKSGKYDKIAVKYVRFVAKEYKRCSNPDVKFSGDRYYVEVQCEEYAEYGDRWKKWLTDNYQVKIDICGNVKDVYNPDTGWFKYEGPNVKEYKKYQYN
ncbi:MAG: hypothetical protein HOI39_00430 [Flavobacteriales bacterium]|jgi:hypothetical protein|nr:hypothetical protein [Flavobacteriales bacterium]